LHFAPQTVRQDYIHAICCVVRRPRFIGVFDR
jgi:hypothetical protein